MEAKALEGEEMDISDRRRDESGGSSTARALDMSDGEAPMCGWDSDILHSLVETSSANDESSARLKGGVVTEYAGTAVAGSGTGCA